MKEVKAQESWKKKHILYKWFVGKPRHEILVVLDTWVWDWTKQESVWYVAFSEYFS